MLRFAMKCASFRQVFVLLLGIFVTLGMGLFAVQANTMNIKMMDMAPGMGVSGVGSCDDCGSPGDSKGMAVCVTPGCVAPVAAHVPSMQALNITSEPAQHLHLDLALPGRDSGPDPYPPRTSNIG